MSLIYTILSKIIISFSVIVYKGHYDFTPQKIKYKYKKINIVKIQISFLRLVWNHLVTVISFAINILMLVTWQAKASLGDPVLQINKSSDSVPPEVDK